MYIVLSLAGGVQGLCCVWTDLYAGIFKLGFKTLCHELGLDSMFSGSNQGT